MNSPLSISSSVVLSALLLWCAPNAFADSLQRQFYDAQYLHSGCFVPGYDGDIRYLNFVDVEATDDVTWRRYGRSEAIQMTLSTVGLGWVKDRLVNAVRGDNTGAGSSNNDVFDRVDTSLSMSSSRVVIRLKTRF